MDNLQSILTILELKLLRKQLCLSVTEAANLIAGKGSITWKNYENGSEAIPKKVSDTIYSLALKRKTIIEEEGASGILTEYHESFDDFKKAGGKSKVQWRLSQSISMELFSRNLKLPSWMDNLSSRNRDGLCRIKQFSIEDVSELVNDDNYQFPCGTNLSEKNKIEIREYISNQSYNGSNSSIE